MPRATGPGARDIMLTLLAQDNMSPVVDKAANSIQRMGVISKATSLKLFGVSMITQRVGQAFTRIGGLALGAAGLTAKMAADFDYGMNLVRTQSHSTEKQFEQLVGAVDKLSARVPQAAGELTEGLYDIFSSIEVSHGRAIKMITQLSHAATAGSTDIRTATRSAVAMLNTFGLSGDSLNRVLDVQFKLVEEGIGTYEEIATRMADVLPPSRALGQSLEEMGGIVSFATRTLGDTSKGFISAARAMDELKEHAKDVEKVMGIPVISRATGEYRMFSDIIFDMGKKLEGMTRPQIAGVFEDVFGEGEIRAMRFFNVAIPNFEALERQVDRFGNTAGGSMREAFEIMNETALNQFKIMIRNLQAAARSLGRTFIGPLTELGRGITKVLDWFRNLDEGTKTLIGRFVVFGGAVLLFSGILLRLISGLTGVISLMGLAGVSIRTTAGIIGGTIGGVAVLVGLLAQLASGGKGAGGSFADFALKSGAVILAIFTLGTLLTKTIGLFGGLVNAVRNGITGFRIWVSGGNAASSMLSGMNIAVFTVTSALTLLSMAFMYAQQRAAALQQAAKALSAQLLSGQQTVQGMVDDFYAWAYSMGATEAQARKLLAFWVGVQDVQQVVRGAIALSVQDLEHQRRVLAEQGITLSRHQKVLYTAALATMDFAKAQAILNEVQQGATLKDINKEMEKMYDNSKELFPGIKKVGEEMDGMSAAEKKAREALQEQISEVQAMISSLDQLEDGLRDVKDAGAWIDNYTKRVIVARVRTQDFEEAVETVNMALENFNEAADVASEALKGISDEAQEAAQVASGAFQDLIGKLDEFANAGGLTADAIEQAMQIQLDTLRIYSEDWQTLLARGLPVALIQQLQAMGLEGAAIIHSLANANDEDFNSIVSSWEASEKVYADVMDNIEKASKASTKGILQSQKELLKTIKEYSKDWDKLLKRGLPKAMAQQLKDMGLEGADIVHELANANEEEFRKITRAWRQSARALSETFNQIDLFGEKIRNLPKNKDININLELDQAREKLDAWLDRLKDLEISVEVGASNLTSPAKDGKGKKAGKHHTGGYIFGSGELPALVEAGEYIFSKRAVSNIGVPTLDAWHNAAKFHEGGSVGTSSGNHGHLEFDFARLSEGVQKLYDQMQAGITLSGATASGLNAKANFALSAVTGTFPWMGLLSGFRPGSIIAGTNTISQHSYGNAIDVSPQSYISGGNTKDLRRLWEVWDWEMKNAKKLQVDYSVLSAVGRSPLQYSRGAFSSPSATNTANHWNHIHMDFLRRGGIANRKTMGFFGEAGREAIIPLQSAWGKRALADALSSAFPQARGGIDTRERVRDIHVHYDGSSSPNAETTVRELDWYRRTRGW